jgi:hypothetical protein
MPKNIKNERLLKMKNTLKTKKQIERDYKIKHIDGKYYQEKPRAGMVQLKPYQITKEHKFGKNVTYEYICPYNYTTHKVNLMSYHAFLYAYHIGDVPEGYDVDHIDGNTLNNDLSNLQLLTHEDNIKKKGGGSNQFGKPKPFYCIETGIEYPSIYRAVNETGVSQYYISETLKGKDPKKAIYHFRYIDEMKH